MKSVKAAYWPADKILESSELEEFAVLLWEGCDEAGILRVPEKFLGLGLWRRQVSSDMIRFRQVKMEWSQEQARDLAREARQLAEDLAVLAEMADRGQKPDARKLPKELARSWKLYVKETGIPKLEEDLDRLVSSQVYLESHRDELYELVLNMESIRAGVTQNKEAKPRPYHRTVLHYWRRSPRLKKAAEKLFGPGDGAECVLLMGKCLYYQLLYQAGAKDRDRVMKAWILYAGIHRFGQEMEECILLKSLAMPAPAGMSAADFAETLSGREDLNPKGVPFIPLEEDLPEGPGIISYALKIRQGRSGSFVEHLPLDRVNRVLEAAAEAYGLDPGLIQEIVTEETEPRGRISLVDVDKGAED